MINKNILILSALCSCCSLWADEVVVRHYNYAGPYEVKKPFLADSLDVNSKRFSEGTIEHDRSFLQPFPKRTNP